MRIRDLIDLAGLPNLNRFFQESYTTSGSTTTIKDLIEFLGFLI